MCNPPTVNTPKLKFATDKRIPAVHATWLWACLRSGRLQSYAEYQLNKPPPPQPRKLNSGPRPQEEASTLSIPEDKSTKARQGNQQPAKIVAKPPRQQRHGALDLALPTEATPTSIEDPVSRGADDSNLTYNEDESVFPGFDGTASLPLRETNANTPRRLSISSNNPKRISRPRSSSAESLIAPAPRKSKTGRTLTSDSVVPNIDADSVIPEDADVAAPTLPQEAPQEKEPAGEKDYSSILAQMRASRKAAPSPADQAISKTRIRRQLGRATSTRSNTSAGDSSGNLLADDDDENTVLVEEYQPSQTLGWESPGAAKAREQMIRKLGGTVQETSVAVEGIGVVRDAGGETMTSRTGRKRRG